jgi:IS5 family transposase
VLTLFADGAESLWDELLPEEVRVLPDDLARLDELLCDPELLVPIAIRWERELREAGRFSDRGRPSLAMESYVRLMVLKHRCGWGYETLMCEVSDSIHLRRFCLLGLSERVPDESTVRKLTRRLGAEVVHELTRELIGKARREKRFRPRAARIDSTVVEADVRYPTDAGLAADGVRALAREGRKLAAKIGAKRTAVRDRSRAAGQRLRALGRTIRRRSGEAKEEVLKLTEQTGRLLAKSVTQADRRVHPGEVARSGLVPLLRSTAPPYAEPHAGRRYQRVGTTGQAGTAPDGHRNLKCRLAEGGSLRYAQRRQKRNRRLSNKALCAKSLFRVRTSRGTDFELRHAGTIGDSRYLPRDDRRRSCS